MDGGAVMARPKKSSKTVTIRVTEEAHQLAQVASGYTGESIVDYASRVLSERGRSDVIALHKEFIGGDKPRRGKNE